MIRVKARRRLGGAETGETLKFDDAKSLFAAQDEAIAEWSRKQGVPPEASMPGTNPCVARWVTGRALEEGRAGLRLVAREPGAAADCVTWEVLPDAAPKGGGRGRPRRRRRR